MLRENNDRPNSLKTYKMERRQNYKQMKQGLKCFESTSLWKFLSILVFFMFETMFSPEASK